MSLKTKQTKRKEYKDDFMFGKSSKKYYLLIACTFIFCFSSVLQTRVAATPTWSYSDPATGYETWSNVKLRMDYSWKLWSTSNNVPVNMWVNRFKNHSHPQLTGVAPLQSVELISNSTSYAPTSYQIDLADDYNNTIEFFDVTLNLGTDFVYDISYNITLQEISWNLNDTDVDEYITSGPFYQNLTGAENNIQVNNLELQSLSYEICNGTNSIAEKVDAIVKWITDNIEYSDEIAVSQGAYMTYFTQMGDCSDFSTLFVALCRIQGIPARKVTGLAIFNNDGYPMEPLHVGDEVSYVYGFDYTDSVVGYIPGHAWTEYYVPGYGFVSMDPTFAQSDRARYMNYMDYIHLFSSVGENFGGGITPPFLGNEVEFGLFPYITTTNPGAIRWELSMDLEILEVDLKVRPLIPFHTGTFILVGLGILAIMGISISLKIKRKN